MLIGIDVDDVISRIERCSFQNEGRMHAQHVQSCFNPFPIHWFRSLLAPHVCVGSNRAVHTKVVIEELGSHTERISESHESVVIR